jgi:exodeoxyribonuclease VII large subunit
VRYDFRRLLGLKRAALDDRGGRFDAALRRFLVERKNRLAQVEAILKERNPLTILKRGYSITRDATGRIIRDAKTVAVGSNITVRLARGEIDATVNDRKV